MSKAPEDANWKAVQKELDSIKRLIVLLLLKTGATQKEIGSALGIDQGTVSRMFQVEKVQKFRQNK
jgi:DNA-directed RNA polymerase specialized sigma subunit